MPQAPVPQSPAWWRDRLNQALVLRWSRIRTYDAYYEGDHPLLFASKKFREAFGGLFSEFSDNWCALVVDAVQERLHVEGFRLDESIKGDTDAWTFWQANNLDAGSELAHTDALISEETYALVEPADSPDGMPAVTVEHPSQMIVAFSPSNRRKVLAAFKRWVDDDGTIRANVYLPDSVHKYRTRDTSQVYDAWVQAGTTTPSELALEWSPYVPTGAEDNVVVNPLGVVPVVPIPNRPRLLRPAASELRSVIPVQNAVNKLIADLMVASEYTAFAQRWVTGYEVEVDADTNQPKSPWNMGIDRLLVAESSEVNFGQFAVGDLTNYVKAIELLVQHIASTTRVPPHYFYLGGQFPSGEAIKSAETGLVAKARSRMKHFGESWEQVIRLCFLAQNDPRATAVSAETIWGDPESRTESEHVDATLKKQALNVPDEQLWEDVGYTPQQIARFKAMHAADALFGVPEVPALVVPPAR